jgi:hypothetical protein
MAGIFYKWLIQKIINPSQEDPKFQAAPEDGRYSVPYSLIRDSFGSSIDDTEVDYSIRVRTLVNLWE